MESNVKPVVPPDFTLPAAYTVTNVPPLHSKMGGFSAETLLAIFYQYPRDIYQELAAQELYALRRSDSDWNAKNEQIQPRLAVAYQTSTVDDERSRSTTTNAHLTNGGTGLVSVL